MTIHIHQLAGCRPTPLALYLKAFGILRIVAEQADEHARGWWHDEQFLLMTKLSRKELERFFLFKYSPTPFLSPWNKGCGFFKADDKGLAPIERSSAERFEAFRLGIRQSRELLDEVARTDATIRAIKDRTKTNRAFQSPEQREVLRKSAAYRTTLTTLQQELKAEGKSKAEIAALKQELETLEFLISDADKPPSKTQAEALKKADGYKRISRVADKLFKTRKAALIPDCRRLWRGRHAEWMAAGIVLDEDQDAKYPSLLGTGGNDGNFDFTNNAMQRLGELFNLQSEDGGPTKHTAKLLAESLFDSPTALEVNAIGQFMPGNGGGANSDTGPDGAPLVNAWDFVLMMEGTIPFAARVTRRIAPNSKTNTSAPFTVHSHAAGHATPGGEKDARGEQWMPIWSRPSKAVDVHTLLGDARMQVDRESVNRPIDAARAISRLGVARGIESFVRYSFLERNGQSNLAVPIGRILVRENPRSHLVDDLAIWMNRLQRMARDSHAPARLVHAERRIADAVFSALTHDYSAARWRAILEAAADVEMIQAAGTAFEAGPIPKLKPAWVSAIYDASDDTSAREVRLALAVASGNSPHTPYQPIRQHFLPLKPNSRQFNTSDKRLANEPQVVATGRDAITDCGEIVLRRFIDAGDDSQGYFPLTATPWCGASLPDLAALIDGHVDLARVLKLARALMALDWKAWSKNREGEKYYPKSHPNDEHPEEAWLAIRLACLPWPIDNFEIKAEHSIVRRLLAGDGSTAAEIAKRRLRSTGLRVPFESAITNDHTARLWAAALAFPISKSTTRRAVEILCPQVTGEVHA